MDYIAIWRSTFRLEATGVTDYSTIPKLAVLCLAFAVATGKYETGFFHMKKIESNFRIQLGEEQLPSPMRMRMDGKSYTEHDSTKAVEVF